MRCSFVKTISAWSSVLVADCSHKFLFKAKGKRQNCLDPWPFSRIIFIFIVEHAFLHVSQSLHKQTECSEPNTQTQSELLSSCVGAVCLLKSGNVSNRCGICANMSERYNAFSRCRTHAQDSVDYSGISNAKNRIWTSTINQSIHRHLHYLESLYLQPAATNKARSRNTMYHPKSTQKDCTLYVSGMFKFKSWRHNRGSLDLLVTSLSNRQSRPIFMMRQAKNRNSRVHHANATIQTIWCQRVVKAIFLKTNMNKHRYPVSSVTSNLMCCIKSDKRS